MGNSKGICLFRPCQSRTEFPGEYCQYHRAKPDPFENIDDAIRSVGCSSGDLDQLSTRVWEALDAIRDYLKEQAA